MVPTQVKELISKNPNQIGKPLMKCRMSDKQWDVLTKINEALTQEYTLRRETLLKRLDVTIQSFKWGDKGKVGQDTYMNFRYLLDRVLKIKGNKQ